MVLKKNKKGQVIVFTKDQLVRSINRIIEKEGYYCDLNSLDISRITDLSYLFSYSYGLFNFRGNISKWNTKNVTNMSDMFNNSQFSGDISNWDTGNVTDMSSMFYYSKFNGDISKWNVGNVTNMKFMFANSKFTGNINEWNPASLAKGGAQNIFYRTPLSEYPPKWWYKR